MSFYYDSRVAYPAVPHAYVPAAVAHPEQRHLQWWHIALLLISMVMAGVGVFARLVLTNLQPLSSEAVPAVASPTPTVPAAPATLPVQVPEEPQPPQPNAKLQADIEAWVKAHPKTTWSVDVRQIDGDLEASLKADQTYKIASLYKLFLLQPLASKVPSSGWNAMIGDRSYKDCIDVMLRLSDNPCAEAIGSRLGWPYVDKQLRSLGYGDTHLGVGEATGTAHDAGLVLRNLYAQNGFDATARQLELKALAAPKKAEGIRGICTGCTVYNKVGYILDYKHDAAIIEKNGHVYSLVILSQGGSWKQIGELAAVIHNYF